MAADANAWITFLNLSLRPMCGIATEVIIYSKIELMAIIFPSMSYFFSPDRTDQIFSFPRKLESIVDP